MKLPDDVRQFLLRRFQSKCREWLSVESDASQWPLEIALGVPTEQTALQQMAGVRAWVGAWQHWQGSGALSWCERQWKTLGIQRLPDKLSLRNADELAAWIGESARWQRAHARFRALTVHSPMLAAHLPRHFDVLADYSDADFRRLADLLDWINANPNSGLYPRQLPIAGLDSKWLEGRKGLVADLVAAGQQRASDGLTFHQRCGLKAPPQIVRMRVLDSMLRVRTGGLGDISAPVEDLACLDLSVAHVLIVENLQTGLALPDMPGTVVFMRLGYSVDTLARLSWIARARCVYWGDLDTHGFAILHRARSHFPGLQSTLMDEDTLLRHKTLWVDEKTQHPAEALSLLTETEQKVYQDLKQQRWGQNVRLEQERIDWHFALEGLGKMIA